MTCSVDTGSLEYDKSVRRWTSASVVLLGLFLLSAPFVSSVFAQINGVPASVTSTGFGGHAGVNAPRASVTSLGPRGFAPGPGGRFSSGVQRDGHRRHDRDHDRDRNFIPYYGGLYAAPYSYPYSDDAADSEDDADADYQGGPTIFDRRGRGERAYGPPASESIRAKVDTPSDPPAPDPPKPEVPQTPTTLVFKDGHQLDVGNYAIVGATLFDLTPGHPRKIALADLDLEATQKQNDDHGVSFQLPPNSQAN